jgi:hypothetical protein
MGGCGGTDKEKKPAPKPAPTPHPAAAPKADAIRIRAGDFEDHDVKILTLGAGECGKSTIWRQLKLVYCGASTATSASP